MSVEPIGQRVRRAVREQLNGLMALQIDEQGAIDLAFAPRPVIHAQHPRSPHRQLWRAPQNPQQRGGTGRHSEAAGEWSTCFATQSQTDGFKQRCEAASATGIGCNGRMESLGEDATTAIPIVAKETTGAQSDLHGDTAPGDIGDLAPVTTVNSIRRLVAHWAGGTRRSHNHYQGNRVLIG